MAELRTQNKDRVRWVARRNIKALDKEQQPTTIAVVYCELENGHKFQVAIPEPKIAFMAGVHPSVAAQMQAENGVIESEVKLAAVREKSK